MPLRGPGKRIAIVLQEAFRADNIDFKLSLLFLDEQEAVVRDPM